MPSTTRVVFSGIWSTLSVLAAWLLPTSYVISRKQKKKSQAISTYDLKRKTVNFIRNVDYARLRNFNLQILFPSEITPTSFYLMKDGFFRKPDKAELASELKTFVKSEILSTLPPTAHERALAVDFMGYARKVPIKNCISRHIVISSNIYGIHSIHCQNLVAALILFLTCSRKIVSRQLNAIVEQRSKEY